MIMLYVYHLRNIDGYSYNFSCCNNSKLTFFPQELQLESFNFAVQMAKNFSLDLYILQELSNSFEGELLIIKITDHLHKHWSVKLVHSSDLEQINNYYFQIYIARGAYLCM